jgi:hypothetical protein
MSTGLLETGRELKRTYRKRIVCQVGHLQELYRDGITVSRTQNIAPVI